MECHRTTPALYAPPPSIPMYALTGTIAFSISESFHKTLPRKVRPVITRLSLSQSNFSDRSSLDRFCKSSREFPPYNAHFAIYTGFHIEDPDDLHRLPFQVVSRTCRATTTLHPTATSDKTSGMLLKSVATYLNNLCVDNGGHGGIGYTAAQGKIVISLQFVRPQSYVERFQPEGAWE